MRIRIKNVKVPLDYQESDLRVAAARVLKLLAHHLGRVWVLREAVDARRQEVHFNVTLGVELPEDVVIENNPQVAPLEELVPWVPVPGEASLRTPPIIVGGGPAGLFAARLLAYHGYRPILIEQGGDVDRRVDRVKRFWRRDSGSTQQYSVRRGWAGTFSDGKLTTRAGTGG